VGEPSPSLFFLRRAKGRKKREERVVGSLLGLRGFFETNLAFDLVNGFTNVKFMPCI
jgi:hypothetical protein